MDFEDDAGLDEDLEMEFGENNMGTIEEELNLDSSPVQNQNKERIKKGEKDKNKIEISVDSVESLVSNISYSAQELEKAVDRVEKNRNLNKILDLLNQIKLQDFSNIEKKIDTKRIEESIKKTIDSSVNKSLQKVEFKKLEAAAQKYEKYGEIFESEEVMNTFDEIDELKNFRKNFKFKSILSAVIITAVITLIATLSTVSMFSDFSSSSTTTGDNNLDRFISKVKYEVRGSDEHMQLVINLNEQIKFINAEDQGMIAIEYKK